MLDDPDYLEFCRSRLAGNDVENAPHDANGQWTGSTAPG